jgi:magnesium transporter
MVTVKVLNEFFFSDVLGKPIFDCQGKTVGRVKDMVVRWDGISPRVTGIKFAKDIHNHLDIDQIDEWNESGITLFGKLEEQSLQPLEDDEIYVGKWLLDKQIIDMKGSRLVRVNDLKLTWVSHAENKYMVLLAVDIGARGLFRRLGLEFLLRNVENKLVGWQYIKPLENRTSVLQLTQEKEQLRQLHPADIADIIENMNYKQRADFINSLDSQQAIDALVEMELDAQVEVISQLDQDLASDILEEMPPDEAADILSELPSDKSQELLNLMESEDAEDVRELMQYEDGTAGALMTTEFIGLPTTITAEQAINRLRELAPEAETIYYLYVVDDSENLEGVLSLRELIVAQPQTQLWELMHTKIVAAHPEDDEQIVADIFNKYGLLALPVVDKANVILGIITVDDVLDILIPERGRSELLSRFIVHKRGAKGGLEQ